jgi:hypothetical protein
MRPCVRTPRMRLRVESAGGQEPEGLSRQPVFPTGHIESRVTTTGHYPAQDVL